MSEEDLVIETTNDDAALQAPPPPQEQATPFHAMAAGEQFTREEYLSAGWTDDQLISAGKMIVIAAPPPQDEQTAPVGMPKSRWIVLDDNDDIPPTGLFVGHNGNSYLLQTGVPMYVPEHVLSVLDDAVMDAPVTDPKTRQVVGYRPRPRYTYREVHAPADV